MKSCGNLYRGRMECIYLGQRTRWRDFHKTLRYPCQHSQPQLVHENSRITREREVLSEGIIMRTFTGAGWRPLTSDREPGGEEEQLHLTTHGNTYAPTITKPLHLQALTTTNHESRAICECVNLDICNTYTSTASIK